MRTDLTSFEDEVFNTTKGSDTAADEVSKLKGQEPDEFAMVSAAEAYSANMSAAETAIFMIDRYFTSTEAEGDDEFIDPDEEGEPKKEEISEEGAVEDIKATMLKIWEFVVKVANNIMEAIKSFFTWISEGIKKLFASNKGPVTGTPEEVNAAADVVVEQLAAKVESMDEEEVKKKWYDPTRLEEVYRHIIERRKEKKSLLKRASDLFGILGKVLSGGVAAATVLVTANNLIKDLKVFGDKTANVIPTLGGLSKEDLKKRSFVDRIFKRKMDQDIHGAESISDDKEFKIGFMSLWNTSKNVLGMIKTAKVAEADGVNMLRACNSIIGLFQKDEAQEVGIMRKTIGTMGMGQQIQTLGLAAIRHAVSGGFKKKNPTA